MTLMLRAAVLAVALILLVSTVVCATVGWPTIPLAIMAALLVAGLLFERYIYKPIRSDAPGAGWDRTQEQFADPRSGRNVAVYYNKRTGERRYVATDGK